MKEKMIENFPLKAMALLFAIVLWIFVVNINDPIQTGTYSNIEVNITHQEVITNTGDTFYATNNSNVVTVVVRAERSVLEDIKAKDIIATADIRELTLDTLVPIRISIPNYEGKYKEAYAAPHNVQIEREKSVSKSFPISVTTIGESDYENAIGELKASSESVEIAGPKSLVGRIEKVVAQVDISGLREDSQLSAKLILYDGGENEIDQSLLSIKPDKSGIKVQIRLLKSKTVPIRIDMSEVSVAEGYIFSGITHEPEKVQIQGEAEDLTQIREIVIPAGELTENDVAEKIERTVDITAYLPEGIELVDENAKNIVISISVDRASTKTIEIAIDAIENRNAPEEFVLDFGDNLSVPLVFSGKDEELEALTVERLYGKVSIDLKGITKEGSYELPINVENIGECRLAEDAKLSVIVTKR
ncbi:MAG: hypothetical protein K2O96_01185 [Lachnospiraceae bacterium]|nr:hypothetical protein [Lachnospiraceae bacterium]